MRRKLRIQEVDNGFVVDVVVIEPDGKDRLHSRVATLSLKDLLEQVAKSFKVEE